MVVSDHRTKNTHPTFIHVELTNLTTTLLFSPQGISRDSLHKRRRTGGKQPRWHKKRKYELGRQPSMTKLAPNADVRPVRVRGGNTKFRALRLDAGNFSWGSESVTRKTRLLDVSYNASNNDLVRTQTLVKNCVIQVDAAPFRAWYKRHYGEDIIYLTKKGKGMEPEAPVKRSASVAAKIAKRNENHKVDVNLLDQFATGRLYACVTSRPGQCGRCDGYILEGTELQFYVKKMQKKKSKA